MDIGVPKEIKPFENRVGLTPASVAELTSHGHRVVVEAGAGIGSNAADAAYRDAGAKILPRAEAVFDQSELIVKVKEPQAAEYGLLSSQHVLFTYLHLAADRALTEALMSKGTTAIAYETITDHNGGLPLLRPMSEVAGRISVQAGAYALQRYGGGAGVLLGGVAGVEAAEVLVIGGGVVGINAIQMALGLHARVTVLDKSNARLAELDQLFDGRLNTVYATAGTIAEWITRADLVIGAVLVPGAKAPKLITREMLKTMKKGAVLVDVAIDQGGCFETSHPTTHAEPTYIVDDIVHYCVANMPGAVPQTSTAALNNATLPYVLKLAERGYREALLADRGFMDGLNVYGGKITNAAVASAFGQSLCSGSDLLEAA